MRISSSLALLAAATILTPPTLAADLPQGAPLSALVKDVSIPYSTFKLKNGLRSSSMRITRRPSSRSRSGINRLEG